MVKFGLTQIEADKELGAKAEKSFSFNFNPKDHKIPKYFTPEIFKQKVIMLSNIFKITNERKGCNFNRLLVD